MLCVFRDTLYILFALTWTKYLLDGRVRRCGLLRGGVRGRGGCVSGSVLITTVITSVQVTGLGPGPGQRTGLGAWQFGGFQFSYQVSFLLAWYLFLSIKFLHHADAFLQNFSPPLLLFCDVFCFVFRCLWSFPFKEISEGIFQDAAAARVLTACIFTSWQVFLFWRLCIFNIF